MRVTKFVHSCLLVETSKIKALIDPGKFTADSHLLNLKKIDELDYIIISHEHLDHYNVPLLKSLSGRFPHATIITNKDLFKDIEKLGLPNQILAGSDDRVNVFEAKHEPLPMDVSNVMNIGVHLDDEFTYPGDSYDFEHSRQILAIPMTGPFASFKQALDSILKIKPKVVLPLHDWEWHKEARNSRYAFAKEQLEPHGIDFIKLENAEPLEL